MVALLETSSVKLRKFEAGDIEALGELAYGGDIFDVEDANSAFTLTVNNKPVAVGGFVVFWSGVAEAWLYTGLGAREIPISVVRTMHRAIQDFARSARLHRLQCIVLSTFTRGLRLANLLGFKPEAVLRRYLNDKSDCILFVRYFDWD